MKAYDLFATRNRRTVLLALLVVAWSCWTIAVAIAWSALSALLVAAVGLAQVVLTKAQMEEARRSSNLAARLDSREARDRDLTSRIQKLEQAVASAVAELASSIAANRAATEGMRRDVERMLAQVAENLEKGAASRQELETAVVKAQGAIEDLTTRAESGLEGLGRDLAVVREALSQTRTLAYKIGSSLPKAPATQAILSRYHDSPLSAPVLSIAIPSYNRPEFLSELLTSVEKEVERCEPGAVEVAIIDDASPDPEALGVALDFVQRSRFAFVRVQPHNVGLERNVLASAAMCTGEYVQIVGNDDLLTEGSLAVILDDLNEHRAAVNVYAKGRINRDGSPRPDVVGSTPIELEAGQTHMFKSLLDAVALQGPLSTLGFISTNVMRREPFVAVDATGYLDLTMYVHVLIMLEAFAEESVLYNNTITVLHRTPDPDDKVAESLGRPDNVFMAGGRGRLSRYFGTSLAAGMQRLIDRGVLSPEVLAGMPENLMSPLPLTEWIIRNRTWQPDSDNEFQSDVVADADRFASSMQAESSQARA